MIEPAPGGEPHQRQHRRGAGVGPAGVGESGRRSPPTPANRVSDYSGTEGIDQRSDLGGLNLTTVPKVLIECANMQNPADAALTESPQWRQQAAQGLADGITAFLESEQVP